MVVRPWLAKGGRGTEKGDAFRLDPRRESPRGRKPRRARAPTRINRSGSEKGHGFFGGRKPLERRCKAVKVLQGSAGAEGRRETFYRSPGRRKALKGEAQERWGLKEASEGSAS